ncbi:acyltransferase [Maridesulfovibrio zosterae]|uniref:LpxL/LpxP family acyltransferase n=1 Tax=Maridesulfovibrio zosterae TaxID=82171 RepID=UPI000486EA26|nr:acyltransferase [Maridesulfovibrio zosterae]
MSRQKDPQKAERWTSKSLASAFFHNIFYLIIRTLGHQAAYLLLFFVVIFYCLLPKIRKRSSYYLQRRFGQAGKVRSFVRTFRLYWNFGKMLVDRSVFRILGRFQTTNDSEHEKELKQLYDINNRLILITGHVGCWQMGISFLDFINAPKAIVMLMETGNVDQHSFKWKKSGARNAEKSVEEIAIINPAAPLGGSLEMLSALKNKSVLCINADRTFGSMKNTVEVVFLGDRISLPVSPYKIAAATGTPIAIVFSERTGAGKGNFRLIKTITVPHDADKGEIRGAEAFKPYAQEYARELEKYCQDYPYQFYNFFNMWQ